MKVELGRLYRDRVSYLTGYAGGRRLQGANEAPFVRLFMLGANGFDPVWLNEERLEPVEE